MRPGLPCSLVWVVLWEAEDLPGQWMVECLDFHIISQGNGPLHALQMIQEAMLIVFEHDIAHGRHPFEVHRPSPKAAWARLWGIVKHGEMGTGSLEAELRSNPATADGGLALQLELGRIAEAAGPVARVRGWRVPRWWREFLVTEER